MTDPNSTDSPFETGSGAAGPYASEAFELLANETRLAILLALWDAYEPLSQSSGMPSSQLRRRVGVSDSGQFNYHPGKLEDQFVEATDDGYKLRLPGEKLPRAVIGGAGSETVSLESSERGMPLHAIQQLRESWLDWKRVETRLPAVVRCEGQRCWIGPLDA